MFSSSGKQLSSDQPEAQRGQVLNRPRDYGIDISKVYVYPIASGNHPQLNAEIVRYPPRCYIPPISIQQSNQEIHELATAPQNEGPSNAGIVLGPQASAEPPGPPEQTIMITFELFCNNRRGSSQVWLFEAPRMNKRNPAKGFYTYLNMYIFINSAYFLDIFYQTTKN